MYTSDQLGVLKDNLTSANSRIKDVDVAEESTQFARYNILVQAGTAMLAQANAVPQMVLRLLS
jgi:flagellin